MYYFWILMQDKILNIVAFDNPYPPNYGGVIDVYYKIKALYEIGFEIHLHCFVKEIPKEYHELQLITASVNFYKTDVKWYHIFSSLPISVISRRNHNLIKNLLSNNAPILFESLKTTCLVSDIRIKNRVKLLRLHNLEQNYFKGIAKSERNLLKKYFFFKEAKKFESYEVWNSFDLVLTLSEFENLYLIQKKISTRYVPVFHGNKEVGRLSEFGQNILFHGDLSTPDNLKVGLFLIDVFKELPDYELVIASSCKKEMIESRICNIPNITFVDLVDFNHLLELFEQAHICISWSFQNSGTKLKLINALFNSRFSLINENIIDDNKIVALCSVARNKEELKYKIKETMIKPYSFSNFENRKLVLESYLNDAINANRIQND